MKTIFLFIFLLAAVGALQSQPGQPARFELVHGSGDQAFTTVSMGENGMALIREKKQLADHRPWEVIFLDTLLHQTWTTEIPLAPRLKLIGYEYAAGEVFFLFRQSESDYSDLHLVRIFLFSRAIQHLNITPQVEFKLTHFVVAGNSAVLGGYVSKQPAILLHDMTADRLKVVPGFFIDNIELLDVKANGNQTFNVLMVDRGHQDKKKLHLKTFDASGTLLLEDDIEIDANKVILAGTTSSLKHDELLLAGVWGAGGGTSKQASGLFSVLADPFNKQTVHYTDFGELQHFLDYLPAKRQNKIKSQAQHRRQASKAPAYRVNVHVIRMEETATGFALLCELYIPTVSTNYPLYPPYANSYNQYYYSPYSFNPYGYGFSPYYWNPMMMNRSYNSPYNPYGSSGRNADVTMLNSSLILFDHNGKVKEDYAFSLDELKLPGLEQTSDFYASNRFVQFYKREKDIFLSTNWDDGEPAERDTLAIQLKSARDVVRNEADDQGGVRYWFSHYGYVWGYETIRNKAEQSGDPVRYVYYVNKIKLE